MQLKIYLSFLCLTAGSYLMATESSPIRTLGAAPLRFEASGSESQAKFVARGARFRFEFSPHQAVLRSGHEDVRLSFDGANPSAQMQGEQLLRSTTNLYFGSEASKWRHAVANFGRLEVPGLYQGIDLAYYGNGGELEYDLTVNPGADARRIRLRLDDKDAHVNRHGDLVSELIQKHPVAYQRDADGSRRSIRSSYRRNADGSYGFQLGAYDHTRALVIDPTVTVAQYFAGSYQDTAYGIGHDSNGLIYIAGNTSSTDLPLVGSSLQTTEGGGQDLFLAVVNPALPASSQVLYVTYIGGNSDEVFGGMTVGPNGDVYLTGSTLSANFPMANAAQTTNGGSSGAADAFVMWLNPSQAVVYSTLFGGSGFDRGKAIAVDKSGNIWIDGDTQSTDLPNSGGFQSALIGTQNMFIAAFNPALSGTATKIYSIYIGGTSWDEAYAIAVAPDGTIWLAGGTYSSNIWIAGNSYQGTYGGDGDAYIAHINAGLGANALLYSSFLGGDGIEEATSMVLDSSGRVVLSGYTLSPNFPVTSNAVQTTYGGNTDAFVSILDTAKGQLVYSTYFGGSEPDAAMDLKIDSSGVLYVSGYTESSGLPSTGDAPQAKYDGYVDAFGLKLNPGNPGLAGVDSFTYLGSDGVQVAYGVDFDSKGNVYLTGSTSGPILAAIGGPANTSITGNVDAFLVGYEAGSIEPNKGATTTSGVPRRFPWRIPPHR
jgi:hypothetical protein